MAAPEPAGMRPEPRIRLTIEAEITELAPASEKIRRFLIENGVDEDAIFAIETVLEEVATNAIKYGFPGVRKGTINFEARVGDCRTEFFIEDDGAAFDPTRAPVAAVNRPLEEMPIGGLGIHLVCSVTDGFEYKRVGNSNHVRVWRFRKE